MTTAQKHKYPTTSYTNEWDSTTSITAHFTQLNHFQVSLEDRGITTSNKEKVRVEGAQMWPSEMFTEEQILAWENKPAINQTWANLQV